MKPEERRFVDGLLARIAARPLPPDEVAKEAFRARIMAPWAQLVPRLAGAVTQRARALDATQRACLRVLEDHPSLLEPPGRELDEKAHTHAVAWFLDRDGALGEELRRAFVDAIEAPDAPVDDWRVQPERILDSGRRVDIEIEVRGRWLCLVEAKIDAPEGDGQLADYRADLDRRSAGLELPAKLVFLAREGRKASVESTSLTWRELLVAWLPVAAAHRGPRAIALSSYLVTLAEDVVECSEPGAFLGWSFASQTATLDLLERIRESP